MTFIPRPQEIYRHFKGNLYQVVAVAEHSETGEKLVVYQALYGDFKTYARPLEMFTDRVDRGKYPDADQEFRFALQGPDSDRQKRETPAAAEEVKEKAPAADAEGKEKVLAVAEEAKEETPAMVEEAKEKAPAAAEEAKEKTPAVTVEAKEKAKENAPAVAVKEEAPAALPDDQEGILDPLLLEFLDADTYEQRLNILAAAHHRITQDMITTMAISCDLEVNDGELEERYETLKRCLITMEKYECNRLR